MDRDTASAIATCPERSVPPMPVTASASSLVTSGPAVLRARLAASAWRCFSPIGTPERYRAPPTPPTQHANPGPRGIVQRSAWTLVHHDRSPTLDAPHQALVLQDLQGLLCRGLRDAFLLRQAIDRGQRVTRPKVTGLDPLPQGSSKPQVGRIAR